MSLADSLFGAALFERDARNVAGAIPSHPGWRAICLVLDDEGKPVPTTFEDGGDAFRVECVEVVAWGLLVSGRGGAQSEALHGFMGSAPASMFAPLAADGRVLAARLAIVRPDEDWEEVMRGLNAKAAGARKKAEAPR